MSRDKQLSRVNLEQVQTKRRLGQALNVKEFAVLAGISYSSAREWFHDDGFPAIRGMVFGRIQGLSCSSKCARRDGFDSGTIRGTECLTPSKQKKTRWR